MVYGQNGVDCHFPRALSASIWGHCSQILVFASIWDTQKGCNNDSFRAVFPSIWYLETPKQCKTRETENDRSTLILPSHRG